MIFKNASSDERCVRGGAVVAFGKLTVPGTARPTWVATNVNDMVFVRQDHPVGGEIRIFSYERDSSKLPSATTSASVLFIDKKDATKNKQHLDGAMIKTFDPPWMWNGMALSVKRSATSFPFPVSVLHSQLILPFYHRYLGWDLGTAFHSSHHHTILVAISVCNHFLPIIRKRTKQ